MYHCILAKYVPEVDEAMKARLQEEIETVFSPLLQIEGIYGVDIIPNVINRPNRYDILIRIQMKPEVLETYDHSEPHKLWKSEYAKYLEKKAIFDYEEEA